MSDVFKQLMRLYERLQREGRVEECGSHTSDGENWAPFYEATPHVGYPFFYNSPVPNNPAGYFGVCLEDSEGQVNVDDSPNQAKSDPRFAKFLAGIEAFLSDNKA